MSKRLSPVFLFLIIVGSLCAQDKSPRLIVRGDDLGYSHAGNEAILKCYTEGIQTTIEVIVPSPWFPEAVDLLKRNPGVDVGIHLVLTSEWDNVKWRPMTDAKTLRDSSGYFYPMLWPNKNYTGQALLENRWDIQDIELEWRAQIELALKKIAGISHITGHMGCTNLNDTVKELADRLAREYKLDINPAEYGVQYVSYDGPARTSEEKTASFLRMLDKLEPAHTYLFVDHPGLNTPELRAISHIGYENVAEDRQGVTDTWTHPEVIRKIRERKIKLISYKELLQTNE